MKGIFRRAFERVLSDTFCSVACATEEQPREGRNSRLPIRLALIGIIGLLLLPQAAMAGCSALTYSYLFPDRTTHINVRGTCTDHASTDAQCDAFGAPFGSADCFYGSTNGIPYGAAGWRHQPGGPFYFLYIQYGVSDIPEADKNIGPPDCEHGCFGDPINAGNGNKFETQTDYVGNGRLPLKVQWTYNSTPLSTNIPPVNQVFGRNRAFEYMQSVRVIAFPGGVETAYVTHADGKLSAFRKSGFDWINVSPTREKLSASYSGSVVNSWAYDDGSDETYNFDSAGKLASIQNRSGGVNTVAYDTLQRIQSVTDETGRAITFQYNTSGLVDRIQLPSGVELIYSYNAGKDLTGTQFQDGTTRQYLYDETANVAAGAQPGLLTGVVDESLVRSSTTKYDSQSRAYETSLADGKRRFSATYQLTSHQLYNAQASINLPNGAVRTVNFTAKEGVILPSAVSTTCAGCTTETISYTYDSLGHQDQVTRNGVITDFDIDSRGFEVQRVEAAGLAGASRTIQTDWDATADVPSARRTYDSSGALVFQTDWTYNSRGQNLAFTQTDPVSAQVRTTTRTYCEQADVAAGICPIVGLLRFVDGPRTDVADLTTYLYYSVSDDSGCASPPAGNCRRKGDLYRVTNAAGQVTEYARYDLAGRATRIKDPNGVNTDLEYHLRGWLTASKVRGTDASIETDDLITRIEYWPTGLVKQVTQPDGTYLVFTYDAAQRLTRITDKAGFYIEYTLDDAGNRVLEETRNPAGSTLYRTLSRVYNALGQLQTQADAASNPTDFTYDANGNADTVTDALDRVTDHDYDPLNRLQRTLQDVGGIEAETALEYDALDNLTKVTDPKGLDTTYVYNGFGDLTQLTSPDTGVTAYTYDSAGNRKTQTDARGVTSTYSYDALNRLTAIGYSTDSTYDIAYTWDTTQASCVTNETFGKGRLTRVQNGHGAIIEYCYSRFGRLLRKKQTINGKAFTVRYAYTKTGALASVTYPDGMVVDYTRNTTGRVNTVGVKPPGGTRQVLISAVSNYPFGPQLKWTYGNGRILNRTHDMDYKPTAMRDDRAGGLQIGYGYDPAGQLDELHLPANPAVQLARYRYDGLSRLDQVQDGPTGTPIDTYSYDATGNRTSMTDSAGAQPYIYPSDSHRLSSVAGIGRGYDDAGNTTSIGGLAREFFYTPGGRMRLVQSNGAAVMNYSYNGLGEQVRRYATTSDPNERYSVYDESGHWLGEYDLNGAPTQQIVWLDDLPVGLVDTAGLKYVEPDHLGTPRAVIDPVRDLAIWKWEATGEAFGNDPSVQDPDGDGTPLVFNMRFPGQRYDAASGLNYNYFRDYEAGTGRYVESDPIGLGGGLSTYGYVKGAPLTSTDPLGLQTTVDTWCRQHPVECAAIFGGGALIVAPKPQSITLPKTSNGAQCKTCAEVYPGYDECSEISRYYPYSSSSHSLLDFPAGSKKRPGVPATGGLCAMKGTHHTVFLNGQYVGSIFSCRCCTNTGGGPVIEERWGNNVGR